MSNDDTTKTTQPLALDEEVTLYEMIKRSYDTTKAQGYESVEDYFDAILTKIVKEGGPRVYDFRDGKVKWVRRPVKDWMEILEELTMILIFNHAMKAIFG